MKPPQKPAAKPESQPAPPPKPKTVPEAKLKRRLLYLMLAIKLVVIGWLFTEWQSGGFSADQFSGTLGLLIPVFTTYTGVMIREVIELSQADPQAQPAPAEQPQRSRSFQWLAFGVLAAYGLGLLLIISLRPQGVISYAQMNTFLTLLEAGFGIYVGRIVFSLFKKSPA
jgi:hypothetical protein